MNKADKMIECSKARSKEKHEKVMNCLTDLLHKGEKITVLKISRLTNVSAPTIYTYEDVMELINKHRGKPPKKIRQSEDSKDAIIKMKNKQIQDLERALKETEQNDNYKKKYLEAREEIAILKKRIEDLMSDNW